MWTTRLFNQLFPLLTCVSLNLEDSLFKAYSTRRRLKFLKDFHAEHVLPKSLLPSRLRYLSGVPFDEFASLILKKHIQETKRDEKDSFKVLNSVRSKFFSQIPLFWKNILLDNIYSKLRRKLRKLDEKLNRKLSNLIINSPWTKNTNADIVQNLSSVHIDPTTLTALGYGLSFSIDRRPSAVKISKAFKDLECRSNISSSNLDIAKGMIYSEMLSPSSFKCNMPRRFIKAINNIKCNNKIHITKADKSNSFVILDKQDYIDKMTVLLNDSYTYSKLNKNPLDDNIKQFNKEIKIILKEHKDTIDYISVRSPSLPYMYGLVKTHKQGLPIRPIISSVGSINYKLSKFLVNMLSPLLGKISGSHLTNNMDLINKLKQIEIDCNSRLISFDVTSLFTKVPIDDLLHFLYSELTQFNLPLSNYITINLIKLCVSNCKFVFNNEFYVQKFGMAMGNPLSPLLSGLYMEFFERLYLPSLNIRWLRYVDDCIAIINKEVNVNNILENLNNKVSTIKFTTELEENNKLPFLDINIHREENSFNFSVYRKPTNNLSYIHYYSGHCNKIKQSVFISMFLRAFRVCTPNFLDEEIAFIYSIGDKLCYPQYFMDGCFSLSKKIFHKNNNSPKNEEQKDIFKNSLIIPYYSKFTHLPQMIRPLGIKIIFTYKSCLKDVLIKNSPSNNNNIIYKIPCLNCNSVYIGQTSKSLEIRVKQHKYNFRTAQQNSACFKHSFETDHRIDWESSVKILNNNNWTERNIIESFLIEKTNNFNISKGLCSFDPVLTTLLTTDLRSLLGANPMVEE